MQSAIMVFVPKQVKKLLLDAGAKFQSFNWLGCRLSVRAVATACLCLLGAVGLSAGVEADQSDESRSLRGRRYCEILVAMSRNEILVYNTTGLNDCCPNQWQRLSTAEIKKETGARYVRLNGPRYWVIDGMPGSKLKDKKIVKLGGIEMRAAAVLQVSLRDLIQGGRAYHPYDVERDTHWLYLAGKPIYELVDPQGQAFVMQSYSVQKVPQTEASLAKLGEALDLPEGWSFRVRVLPKDAYLTPVDHKAVVVQDEFQNTYQQETPSFNG